MRYTADVAIGLPGAFRAQNHRSRGLLKNFRSLAATDEQFQTLLSSACIVYVSFVVLHTCLQGTAVYDKLVRARCSSVEKRPLPWEMLVQMVFWKVSRASVSLPKRESCPLPLDCI